MQENGRTHHKWTHCPGTPGGTKVCTGSRSWDATGWAVHAFVGKKKKKISSPADRKQAALTATRRGNISPARNARSGTVTEKSSHFVCSHKVQRYRAALKMCEFICGFMLLLEGTTQVFRPGGSTVSTRYIHWNAANASTEKPSFPYV